MVTIFIKCEVSLYKIVIMKVLFTDDLCSKLIIFPTCKFFPQNYVIEKFGSLLIIHHLFSPKFFISAFPVQSEIIRCITGFPESSQSPLPRRAGCPADLPRPVLTAILGLFPSPGSCVEALVSWSLQLLSRFTFGVGRVPCMLTPPARGHWGGPRRRAGDWDGLSGFLSCPVGSCLAFKKSSEFQFLPAVLVAISSACARPQVEKFVLSVGRFLPFAVQITWLRCS